MELILFIFLTFICLFATVIFLVVRSLPEREEDSKGWPGMEFIFIVIAAILWISVGISAIDLETTFVYSSGSDYYTYVMEYANTWPITLIYVIISIPHVMLVLFLWPESWKDNKPRVG